jgi:hypothetical protein
MKRTILILALAALAACYGRYPAELTDLGAATFTEL